MRRALLLVLLVAASAGAQQHTQNLGLLLGTQSYENQNWQLLDQALCLTPGAPSLCRNGGGAGGGGGGGGGGSGNVTGPGPTVTPNAIATFNGTGGLTIRAAPCTIDVTGVEDCPAPTGTTQGTVILKEGQALGTNTWALTLAPGALASNFVCQIDPTTGQIPAPCVAWDSTAVNTPVTWGNGSATAFVWTYDMATTDIIESIGANGSNGEVRFTGNLATPNYISIISENSGTGDAQLRARALSGNSFTRYVSGAQNWVSGINVSAGNNYELAASGQLGSLDVLECTPGGACTFPDTHGVTITGPLTCSGGATGCGAGGGGGPPNQVSATVAPSLAITDTTEHIVATTPGLNVASGVVEIFGWWALRILQTTAGTGGTVTVRVYRDATVIYTVAPLFQPGANTSIFPFPSGTVLDTGVSTGTHTYSISVQSVSTTLQLVTSSSNTGTIWALEISGGGGGTTLITQATAPFTCDATHAGVYQDTDCNQVCICQATLAAWCRSDTGVCLTSTNCCSPTTTTTTTSTTSTTTTTTTTTTSTTTTTMPGGFPVNDTFTRAGPALGANWTQPFGSALTIYNSSVAAASVTSSSLVEYWQTNTFASDDSYACVKIGAIGTPTSTVVQAGACIVINTGSDAVCCDANYNVAGSGWQIDYFDNTVYHTGASGASPTVAVGDYIGIHRIDTTHFQCFKATAAAPTTWTDVSGSQVVSGIGSNGNPGMYSYIEATNNIQGNDLFEGGVGALPTTHACGQ